MLKAGAGVLGVGGPGGAGSAAQAQGGLVHVGAGDFRLRGWVDERWLHAGAEQVRFGVREGRSVRDWVRDAVPT